MKNFDIDDLKVIAGPACDQTLISSAIRRINELANRQSFQTTEYIRHQFRDGEKLPQIVQNIRGADLFIIQPTPTESDYAYLELLIDAVARASADTITVIMPYAGYLRQDRKDRPRVPITAKLMMKKLEAALCIAPKKHIIFFHPHFSQIQGFIDITSDILYPSDVFLKEVRTEGDGTFENMVSVAADTGAVKLAERYAQAMGVGLAICLKKRLANDQVIIEQIIGDVRNKIAVIFDDISDTGGTVRAAEKKLYEEGAKKVIVCLTHGVFPGDAAQKLADTMIDRIIVTNSINHAYHDLSSTKFKIVDIGALIGEAIWRTHTDGSISAIDGMFSLSRSA